MDFCSDFTSWSGYYRQPKKGPYLAILPDILLRTTSLSSYVPVIHFTAGYSQLLGLLSSAPKGVSQLKSRVFSTRRFDTASSDRSVLTTLPNSKPSGRTVALNNTNDAHKSIAPFLTRLVSTVRIRGFVSRFAFPSIRSFFRTFRLRHILIRARISRDDPKSFFPFLSRTWPHILRGGFLPRLIRKFLTTLPNHISASGILRTW